MVKDENNDKILDLEEREAKINQLLANRKNRKQSSALQKRQDFETMLETLLPCVGTDPGKMLLAQVIVSLKLQGVSGKNMDEKQINMVHVIQDSLLKDPIKYKEALKITKKLLE